MAYVPPLKPILVGRDKPLKDPKVAETAVLNALRALARQSEALTEADYTCAFTIKQARQFLKLKTDEMAARLGISENLLDLWESRNHPDVVAKTMAYTAKMIDEVYRLLSFSQGGPDSRSELNLGDLLKFLTAEQFGMFITWVEEGKKRAIMNEPVKEQKLLQ